jgi:arylsulfatase A-like enzyme
MGDSDMNVIFIMNDSFRRDHLGCYGNTWIKTPNLDQLARQSALFEQFYIASYPTVPNRWDLSTGRFGFPFRGWQPLGEGDRTWGQMLSEHGIHTQMIWDTPMLGKDNYNYTRGFRGLYFVHSQKGDPWITDTSLPIRMPSQAHKIRSISSLESYLRNHFHRRLEREFCVGRTITAAADWLETNAKHEPFFLWIDMWDPHEPFDCPWYDYELYGDPAYSGDRLIYPEYGRPTYMTEEEQKDLKALYAGNITLVDRWFGHFMRTVEKLGLLKKTLVIWTTDHGHLFGDHDLQGKPGAELGNLYETTTRIPLLVYHPEGLGAGERIQGIVQPPDILPSILEALELPVAEEIEGNSFWPLVTGSVERINDCAFSSRFPPTAGDASYTPVEGAVFDGWVGSDRIVEASTVTDDQWALICAPGERTSLLFDIQRDPDQENNVIDQHPDVAERMHRKWIGFLEAHGAPESRIRPFREGFFGQRSAERRAAGRPGGMPLDGKVYAFRDDRNQWIAHGTVLEARRRARDARAPGPSRRIEEVAFGEILEDGPKNLVHLYGQYYWAEDLA